MEKNNKLKTKIKSQIQRWVTRIAHNIIYKEYIKRKKLKESSFLNFESA
jgi:hypothetical protein